MSQATEKNDLMQKLQREILSLQGYRPPSDGQQIRFGLGPIEKAFPHQTFPTAAVHEFLGNTSESAAATSGFIAGLLGPLMRNDGICLWIGTKRTVFPPALKIFGIDPDRVIFIDLVKEKDALWAMEEALKCEALAAVVGELRDITFTESRRLQLAVEQSRVTGFLHRNNPRNINPLACVTRWKINPVPSQTEKGMPGLGFPRWQVDLLKVRNGETGSWQMEWSQGAFHHCNEQPVVVGKVPLLSTG